MASTFHGLELGKRGLAVAQTSISTTGHNIANANTKGYSRQQVNQTASPALDVWANGSVNPSQLGQGALVESITRVRDRFLDAQYRDQSATAGEWSVRQETLGRIEVAINEPSETGLRASMDQLASAWQDVANDPSSGSAQAVLKERAQAFVQVAQGMDTSLGNIASDLQLQQGAAVDEANGYLEQIAELNQSILQSGKNSNDLLDQRDVLVEQLSSLIPVKVAENKNGVYDISLASGKALVTGTTKVADVVAADGTKGGKLAGINESLKAVEGYQTDLTNVVEKFAAANGMGEADGLFASGTPFTIQNLTVNETATYKAPADLEKNAKAAQSDFRTLVSQLGAQSQGAMNAMANSEAALMATDNRRQSVTGISIDEEMANLIKYQHSYSAAARFVSTTDQMLDTIINRMAR
jgi:flagellar hook-associated protein 1 FlgK